MARPAPDTVPLLKYLQTIVFGAAILYFGRSLLIPVFYGLLIAIVLYPVCRWLEARGWPRSLAITLGLLIVAVLFAALVGLLVMEIKAFRNDLPDLLVKVKPSLGQLQQWIESGLGISTASQTEWWQRTTADLGSHAGNIVQTTLSAMAGTLVTIFLVPVYTALFLYNRGAFVRFLAKIAGRQHHRQLQAALHEVILTYFNFIKGMILVYLIVGTLNSIGLLALGIDHAILFGMLTAIMTIIPYIGIIVSALLPISVAWITRDSIWYPVGVVAVFVFVQYLEANVIFPRVVASQLKVSTWGTLLAIVAGGLLWGVSGMILFIPFLGILKIVLNYIPDWKFLNILLGREET